MRNYQLFCDMDGVLVNFEGGVLAHMNEVFRPAGEDPNHPMHKLARACADEVGGFDVVLNEEHIKQGVVEDDLPGNVHARAFMKELVGDNIDLWSHLNWELNGKVLWEAIKRVPGLRILSAPMKSGSQVGKRIWCERELGMSGENVILSDSKQRFGHQDGILGILIDDRDKYINEFREGGGIAIHYNRNNPEVALSALQAFGII
jgi:hypothetical protein